MMGAMKTLPINDSFCLSTHVLAFHVIQFVSNEDELHNSNSLFDLLWLFYSSLMQILRL